jgi:endonuclease/exonuclease/phosphatase (EEP) superfamily protein YafD
MARRRPGGPQGKLRPTGTTRGAADRPAPDRHARRRSQILTSIAIALTVLAGLPTLLAFAGRWWWPFDLASSFRLHYAMVLAVATIGLLLLGRRGLAGAAAVLLLVNVVVVAPLWFGRTPPPEGPTLRVLAHNIYGGGPSRHAEILAALPSARADLAFFSQAMPDLAAAVEAGGTEHRLLFPREETDSVHALMVATAARDVIAADQVSLGPASPSSAVAVDVELDGRLIRVLGVHTRSPRTPSRAAIRDSELRHVAAWVRAQEVPVLVVGDLNTTPWSHAFRDLLAATELRDSQRGFGLQPTWPAGSGLAMIPIDHALVSPELAVVRRTTGPARGSAHRSLTIEVGWADADDG